MMKANMYVFLIPMILPALIWFGAKDINWFMILFGSYIVFIYIVNNELTKLNETIERQDKIIDRMD